MEEQFLTCSYSGILEISRVVILTWVDWRFPSRTLVVWRVIIVKVKAVLLARALLLRFIVVKFTIV